MQRRRFLAACSATIVTSGLRSVFGGEAGERPVADAGGPLVDCHIHPMSQALHDLISPFVTRQGSELKRFTGAEIVNYLDGIGAQRAYALSTAYLWGGMRQGETAGEFAVKPGEYEKVRAENDFVADEAAKYPGRIIPFLGINPLKPYALEELDRCTNQSGMRGLKLHFWNSGVNLRDDSHLKRIRPVFEYAASHDLPVMLHFYNGRVEDFGARDGRLLVDNILIGYPDLRICFAHFLGAGNYADAVGDIVDTVIQASNHHPQLNRENLFLDLSAIFNRQPKGRFAGVTDGQLIRLGKQVRDWGLKNILWGSDKDEKYLAGMRAMWPLDDAELRTVLNNDGGSYLEGLAG